MNRKPIQGEVRDRARGRPRVQLAEPLAQVAAHVAYHFWRCKPPPNRLALRCQSSNALQNGNADLRIEERGHSHSPFFAGLAEQTLREIETLLCLS